MGSGCIDDTRGGRGTGTSDAINLSPGVIDVATASWASKASRALKNNSFAILRLPQEEARLVRAMYDAAEDAFYDCASRRQLRAPADMIDDLDGRNGIVGDPNREWLELHCSTPADYDGPVVAPAAVRMLDRAERATSVFRARCQLVLQELGEAFGGPLKKLLTEEELAQAPQAGAVEKSKGYSESMLRLYRYSSDFRLREGNGHHDMVSASSW